MEDSGINFKKNIWIGKDIEANELANQYDAIVLCIGSTIPRDIKIPGREAKGIYFAMDFLEKSNRYVANGQKGDPEINVKDKHVIVIGGGDTGSDCVGTSNRQGARSITQIELLSKPFSSRTGQYPWPNWPMTLRTSTSHEEGCERQWSLNTKRFITDTANALKGIEIVEVKWDKNLESGHYHFQEIQGSEQVIPADIIFIAVGFLFPDPLGLITQLGLETDERGNVKANNYQTNHQNIFVAGDMHRGQSLVVWAISEGREAAKACDTFLIGRESLLGTKEAGLMNV